jgi:hypothetical protein
MQKPKRQLQKQRSNKKLSVQAHRNTFPVASAQTENCGSPTGYFESKLHQTAAEARRQTNNFNRASSTKLFPCHLVNKNL